MPRPIIKAYAPKAGSPPDLRRPGILGAFKMKRREFLALAGAAALPLAAHAQRSTTPLLGYLGPATIAGNGEGFFEGLRELGYIDGSNIRIEARWANGRFERLPEMAAELVRLDVNVLVASLTQASLEAKKATARIPIVMAGVGDPVAVGLIASLARPGGNVTGTSSVVTDVLGKQIELLRELIPDLPRVAVLTNPANPAFRALQLSQVTHAAQTANIQLQFLEASTLGEIERGFADIVKANTRALSVLGDPLFSLHVEAIANFAIRHRLPTASGARPFAEGGILSTYGPSLIHSHKRAAVYVDRILKGARPADLPVEQPTTFELIINLKTARALGLTIPPTLLARANAVIE
jgi:putative ABC transport system substrate-binding protein